MKKLSVSELAKLYGYSRQAIYAHINKGNLSKGSDGLIDVSEALRVFGEPQNRDSTVNQSKSTDSQNLKEIDMLKRQVDILERQLNQSNMARKTGTSEMSTGDYISIGIVIFNILLGLIAFFGGIVIRGLSDSIKDLRDTHEGLRQELVHYVRKDDYREDIADLKSMITRLLDRLDKLAEK